MLKAHHSALLESLDEKSPSLAKRRRKAPCNMHCTFSLDSPVPIVDYKNITNQFNRCLSISCARPLTAPP